MSSTDAAMRAIKVRRRSASSVTQFFSAPQGDKTPAPAAPAEHRAFPTPASPPVPPQKARSQEVSSPASPCPTARTSPTSVSPSYTHETVQLAKPVSTVPSTPAQPGATLRLKRKHEDEEQEEKELPLKKKHNFLPTRPRSRRSVVADRYWDVVSELPPIELPEEGDDKEASLRLLHSKLEGVEQDLLFELKRDPADEIPLVIIAEAEAACGHHEPLHFLLSKYGFDGVVRMSVEERQEALPFSTAEDHLSLIAEYGYEGVMKMGIEEVQASILFRSFPEKDLGSENPTTTHPSPSYEGVPADDRHEEEEETFTSNEESCYPCDEEDEYHAEDTDQLEKDQVEEEDRLHHHEEDFNTDDLLNLDHLGQ